MSGVGQLPNRSQSAKPRPTRVSHTVAGPARRTNLRGQPAEIPIADRVASWLADNDKLAELESRWQQLETSLFAKAAAAKIDVQKALAGQSREARAMRSLDNDIANGFRDLAAKAHEIRSMKAASLADALAKVELGLRAQGPYDWREHAQELISDGISELGAMLESAGLLTRIHSCRCFDTTKPEQLSI